LQDEKILDSYKGIRDGLIFTNRRIIFVDVQGITGKRHDYSSLPYKNIVAYCVKNAGN